MTVLDGVRARMKAPFFDALRAYADQPIGNFHALPIARGHSVFNSRWIQDFGRSTAQPVHGRVELHRRRPRLAARADRDDQGGEDARGRCFGARGRSSSPTGRRRPTRSSTWRCCGPGTSRSSIATATSRTTTGWRWPGPGRSTSTPIRCSGSRSTAACRSDPQADAARLRREGQLDRVRLVVLTNVTFDGLVYNPERVMEELLAIHPSSVPVGRGVVRLRPLPAPAAAAHGDGGGEGAGREARIAARTGRSTGAFAPTWDRTGWTGSPTSRSSSGGCSPIRTRRRCGCSPRSRPTSRCRRSVRRR